MIEVTYFGSSVPIVHKFELYKTDRIDCYDVFVDDVIYNNRIGWGQILTGIRKAMPQRVKESVSIISYE